MPIKATESEIEAFLAKHPDAKVSGSRPLPGCPAESPTPSPSAPKAKKAAKAKGRLPKAAGLIPWAKFGLPEPEREYRFCKRKWRFDYAWPERQLALEVEGGVWSNGRHTRGKGFLGDMAKYNEAVLLGWRLLRCTPKNIETKAVVPLILRAFAMEKT